MEIPPAWGLKCGVSNLLHMAHKTKRLQILPRGNFLSSLLFPQRKICKGGMSVLCGCCILRGEEENKTKDRILVHGLDE